MDLAAGRAGVDSVAETVEVVTVGVMVGVAEMVGGETEVVTVVEATATAAMEEVVKGQPQLMSRWMVLGLPARPHQVSERAGLPGRKQALKKLSERELHCRSQP